MTEDMTHPALKAGLVLLFVFAFGSVALFSYQSVRNFNRPDGNDLTVYLNAADEFYQDVNPYQHEIRRYIYPLFLTTVLYPLALVAKSSIGKIAVSGLWAFLSFLVFFVTVRVIKRRVSDSGEVAGDASSPRARVLFYALMIVALYPFLQDEFLNGQINLLVIGLVGLFFVLMESGKQMSAAFVLSVAVSIKLAPGIFILYALGQRQWRTVLYFAVMTPALIFGVPALVSSHVLEFYTYYIHIVTATLTAKEASFGFRSFSILSTVTHSLSVTLPSTTRIVLSGALTVVMSLPVFMYFRHGMVSHFQRLGAFGLITSIIPLVFPMSESHHLLLLTFPVIVILVYLRGLLSAGVSLFRDNIAIVFMVSLLVLHIGQALKDTPLRFLGLCGLYFGLAFLLRKLYFAQESGSVSPVRKR